MPFSAKSLSRLWGTASVKLRLNIIKSRQSIRASPVTPCPRIRVSASIASAPLISILLRIATAKDASPAERTVIDQCYRPPCGTHSRACHLRGSARADDHEIVGLHDAISSEGSQKGGREWPPKCQEFHEEAHRHHGTFSGVRPVSSVAFGGCCAYTGGAGRDCTSNALHGSRGTIIRKSTEVCTLLSVY